MRRAWLAELWIIAGLFAAATSVPVAASTRIEVSRKRADNTSTKV